MWPNLKVVIFLDPPELCPKDYMWDDSNTHKIRTVILINTNWLIDTGVEME